MRKILYQSRIYRKDLRCNPTVIYLFGDNEVRSGFGGQAKEMRGEPNAIGIRTKRLPTQNEDAYWSDDRFSIQTKMIDEDFDSIPDNVIVVIPLDGIGTGLSELPKRAPDTWSRINYRIKQLASA